MHLVGPMKKFRADPSTRPQYSAQMAKARHLTGSQRTLCLNNLVVVVETLETSKVRQKLEAHDMFCDHPIHIEPQPP